MANDHTFATWAPIYRQIGLEPRPVRPGTKACRVAGWQTPDAELADAILGQWLTKYASYGIGLLMGTTLPDGTRLGALDIDHDQYVRVGRALLNGPPCGRFGSKGAVFFVRVRGDVRNMTFNAKLSVDEKPRLVAEGLFTRKLCVIPPTIHPDTQQQYRWLGKPLYETDLNTLPLIGD